MAGHSKWANIQHRKGAQDKKRAVLFSRLSREIMIASRTGGPDPESNARLRLAVANARAQSVPKDNIKRAIDKGQGGNSQDYAELRYEGFGPGGIGIIVEVSTDNKNRTAGEVRATFAKNGGQLGETGSVSFGYDQVGMIRLRPHAGDEEAIMEAALEADATDVEFPEGRGVIYTARDNLMAVVSELEAILGADIATSIGLIWKPANTVPVHGEQAEQLTRLLDALDGLEDVQNVYDNAGIIDAPPAG